MPTVTEHPPVKPVVKQDFRSPLDVVETVAQFKKVTLPLTPPKHLDPKQLLGTWFNCDRETRSIVKVEITQTTVGINIHVFGACHPTPCDWHVVPAKMFADNVCSPQAVGFTGEYKFDFKQTVVAGRLEFGALFLETFNHFTDASGRSDYNSVDVLFRNLDGFKG